jgi:hypothetical protein
MAFRFEFDRDEALDALGLQSRRFEPLEMAICRQPTHIFRFADQPLTDALIQRITCSNWPPNCRARFAFRVPKP